MTEQSEERIPVSAEQLARLGVYATKYVKPGYVVGLGTGHAATAFIQALAERRLPIKTVATSKASEELARKHGMAVFAPDQVACIDVTVDGADEVDPKLDLIKGYGGALVREKIVAAFSRRRVMVVGSEKLVRRLGQRGRIPVEVIPFAVRLCTFELSALGLKPSIRLTDTGDEFITDNGNLILDCSTAPIANAGRLERALRAIPGVVGTGLFIGMASLVLVVDNAGKFRTLRVDGTRTGGKGWKRGPQ